MKTLNQAIKKVAPIQGAALIGYLNESGIQDWSDITPVALNEFKDLLAERLCANSIKTYCAILKSVLHKYGTLNFEPNEILRTRGEQDTKTYLTKEELERFERVDCDGKERLAQRLFLISAYTGMRISDTFAVRPENIQNNTLQYTSIKTSITATVPCTERVAEWIKWVNDCGENISLPGYNKAIKRIAERAEITERVSIFREGKTIIGRKCDLITSHTARISFCSNLSELGVSTKNLALLAGHTNESMTARYCANRIAHIPEVAMAFFN